MSRLLTTLWVLLVPWIELNASTNIVADAFAYFLPASKESTRRHHGLNAKKSSWSIGDDWSSLSNENPVNSAPDSDEIFNADLATQAARRMEYSVAAPTEEEDEWISQAVDEVHNHGLFHTSDDPSLYDTGFETYAQSVSFLDEMGHEISMLVHCNERPEELLVREGRALPPLSHEERNDVSQLVTQTTKGEFVMTDFFRQAVKTMFEKHAKSEEEESGESCMFLDAARVAAWMTQCLGEDKHGKITQHDRRVLTTVATHSTYGTGRLELKDFEGLYLTALKAFLDGNTIKAGRDKKMELPTIDSIWRDIRNHGILAPVERERQSLADQLRETFGAANDEETNAKGKHIETLMDECEIVEWVEESKMSSFETSSEGRDEPGGKKKKSSYEMVELASDEKTPLRMKDGDFVFIDEESCIGCTMCATTSPSSFLMLESGRARTFAQRRTSDVSTAISVCPVNCMHRVSFDELKEMETARDNGDGRTDHRHLGHRRGHTPLSVSGIDSDANHRSSWYHYLKQKCYTSSDCPKRGCYDCPNFRQPGDNPFYKVKQIEANRVRVKDMVANGNAALYRKAAEL